MENCKVVNGVFKAFDYYYIISYGTIILCNEVGEGAKKIANSEFGKAFMKKSGSVSGEIIGKAISNKLIDKFIRD